MKQEVINLRVSEAEKAMFKTFAAKKDIPMSQMIREAIREYIQNHSA